MRMVKTKIGGIMFKILLGFLGLFFVSCASHPPLKTVQKIDPERYMGKWYEIARYEHSFEKGCSDVSATYSLKENNKIKVVNSCTKQDNSQSKAIGIAHSTDDSFSKLKVSFFRPFYGDYQILMIGESYEWAVIGEPSREYFWILSRTKTLDKDILQNILKEMPKLGYDKEKLIWTKQS
jgi:apolipoprotein D and lipocalin family protein